MPQPTHTQLYLQRAQPGASQEQLAPLEHQAFAREWTEEEPWVAVPSLGVAIPLYSAAKAFGLIKARSPASFAEVMAGYKGILEGLQNVWEK